jgi:hypothetical protein
VDEITQILALINKKSAMLPLVGTFVSASATGCVVDAGGGRIPARFGTSYLPEINESVLLWFIDGMPFLMGPATAKPGQGTVVSVAAGLVTMSTALGNVVVPYASTLTPTAGQVMKLSWQGGGYAHSVMSTSPVAPVAPAGPGTGAISHTDTFTAVDAGSYQSSWWTGQVYASDSNLGAAMYGSKIADTIPSTAAIQSVQLYISAQQITGYSPNFALHPHQSKPGGAPSLSSSTAIAIAPGWVNLPASWGDALKAGGGFFGIGLNHGGYSILRSLAQDGQSMALRIVSTY